jgi:putative SbcD/Mre11-related phosphoesterase
MRGQGQPSKAGTGLYAEERPCREIRLAPGVLISNALCAYLEGPRAAIVCDLHLGMEAVAGHDGTYYPARQKPVLIRRLKEILYRFRPEFLVIAGDFKHNFSRNLRQEMDEVRSVFDYLDSKTQVVLTKGNHDNFLKSILPGTPLPESVRLGDVLICHGHREQPEGARPERQRLIVIGHEHPALKLMDSIGASVTAPAFIFDEGSGTLVLPALSPLASGTDILREEPLSPVLRRLPRDRLRIFAVSGSGLLDFGTVGELGPEAGEKGSKARI